MAITPRRSNLFPKFRKIPAALDEYYAMAVSNRDLEPSGDIFQNFACDLGFAGYGRPMKLKQQIFMLSASQKPKNKDNLCYLQVEHKNNR